MKTLPILAATLAFMSSAALTQEPNPSPPAADKSIPGKDILPQEQALPVPPDTAGKSRNAPLPEKIDPNVVSPSSDVDPGLRIPAPVLDPLTTMVLPRPPEDQSTNRSK